MQAPRRRWGTAVRWAVALAAIAGALLLADPRTLRTGARELARQPLPLAAALSAYALGFALRAMAWGPLLPVRVAWRRRFRAILAMLAANHLLPGPVGELVRARLVTGPELSLTRSLVAVGVARAVDVFVVGSLLGAAALTAGEAPGWVRWAAPAAVVIPLLAVWVARSRGPRLPWSDLGRAVLWALPSWVVEAGILLAVASSAGLRVSGPAALLATCAALIAQVLAFLPGGVGTYEAGMTTALVALGVPAADALAVAVIAHGVKFLFALAAGLPALLPARGWSGEERGRSSPRPPVRESPGGSSRTPASADDRRPVVVVLPVHDEAATVAAVIGRTPADVHGRPVRVVVVDDGSTDGSAALAGRAGAAVVSHGTCRGLGAAVRSGFTVARELDAFAVAFLDADGEYDPRELPRVLTPIADGEADYVVGSRFDGTIEAMHLHRRLGNRLLTRLTALVAGQRITDGQSGFRALNRPALEAAEIEHDYNYAQVLTLDLLRKGFRYAEVPIRYRRRQYGRSFVRPARYLRHVLPAMARVVARTR